MQQDQALDRDLLVGQAPLRAGQVHVRRDLALRDEFGLEHGDVALERRRQVGAEVLLELPVRPRDGVRVRRQVVRDDEPEHLLYERGGVELARPHRRLRKAPRVADIVNGLGQVLCAPERGDLQRAPLGELALGKAVARPGARSGNSGVPRAPLK